MNLAGQKFGEFEILDKLGEGGMGTVYKGRQSALRRTVAIKMLQSALATDPEYVSRFNNEAVAAAALAHPNLVQVHAAGETQGVHWFAMEYVDGESVQKRLERMGKLSPMEALAICMHVVAGLGYGWKKAQLIHRDIKPDNIFLSTEGEVKLGDLGLAKSIAQENSLTMTGASMGTPLYISPEQTEGRRDVTFSTDIYSLGCTLFHLMSGRAPYHGETAFAVMLQHVSGPIPNLMGECAECTEVLAAVVQKMMSKSPADRHQSYEELAWDLQTAYDSLSGPSPAAPTPLVVSEDSGEKDTALAKPSTDPTDPTGRNLTRRTRLLALAGIALMAVMVTALVLMSGGLRSGQKPPPISRNQTVDLLALVDPARDWIKSPLLGTINHWEKDDSRLRYLSDGKAGKVVPPLDLKTNDYLIEVHYKRLGGKGQFHVDIPLPERRTVPLILDKAGEKIVHHRGLPEWPADRPSAGKVVIHVKIGEGDALDALEFDLGDEKPLPPWRGRLKEISRPQDGDHPYFQSQLLTSLVCMRDTYEFSKWTVTALSGTIEVLR